MPPQRDEVASVPVTGGVPDRPALPSLAKGTGMRFTIPRVRIGGPRVCSLKSTLDGRSATGTGDAMTGPGASRSDATTVGRDF